MIDLNRRGLVMAAGDEAFDLAFVLVQERVDILLV